MYFIVICITIKIFYKMQNNRIYEIDPKAAFEDIYDADGRKLEKKPNEVFNIEMFVDCPELHQILEDLLNPDKGLNQETLTSFLNFYLKRTIPLSEDLVDQIITKVNNPDCSESQIESSMYILLRNFKDHKDQLINDFFTKTLKWCEEIFYTPPVEMRFRCLAFLCRLSPQFCKKVVDLSGGWKKLQDDGIRFFDTPFVYRYLKLIKSVIIYPEFCSEMFDLYQFLCSNVHLYIGLQPIIFRMITIFQSKCEQARHRCCSFLENCEFHGIFSSLCSNEKAVQNAALMMINISEKADSAFELYKNFHLKQILLSAFRQEKYNIVQTLLNVLFNIISGSNRDDKICKYMYKFIEDKIIEKSLALYGVCDIMTWTSVMDFIVECICVANDDQVRYILQFEVIHYIAEYVANFDTDKYTGQSVDRALRKICEFIENAVNAGEEVELTDGLKDQLEELVEFDDGEHECIQGVIDYLDSIFETAS